MSNDEAKSFLEIFVETTLKDFQGRAQDFAFDQLETVLGIVVKKAVHYAMGPTAIIVPITDVLSWGARTVFASYQVWRRTRPKPVGTMYNIRTTKRGILVAENTNPTALRNIPIPLPEYAEFSLDKLQSSQPKYTFASAKRIDSSRVFRDIWALDPRTQCPVCRQKISVHGSLVLGHAADCPRSPVRQWSGRSFTAPEQSWRPPQIQQGPIKNRCVFCGNSLTVQSGVTYGHAPDCRINPQRFGLGRLQPLQSPQTSSTSFSRRLTRGVRFVAPATPREYDSAGVTVGKAAVKAIRGGSDLYAVGVIDVVGNFSQGDRIVIFSKKGKRVAKGYVNYSSSELERIKGRKSNEIQRILGVHRGDAIISHDRMKVKK